MENKSREVKLRLFPVTMQKWNRKSPPAPDCGWIYHPVDSYRVHACACLSYEAALVLGAEYIGNGGVGRPISVYISV